MASASDIADIREAVAALCARFPGEYWRELDRERAYPTEFVGALTEAGFLAASFPRSMAAPASASSPPRRSSRRSSAPAATAPPATRRCTSWARCCATAAPAQKAQYLPKIAIGRAAPAGVRRHRADHRHRHHRASRTTARREGDHYIVNGQKVWTSRVEHSDLMLLLARTTPRGQAVKQRPTASRCSSSTCARRAATASPSGRSAP